MDFETDSSGDALIPIHHCRPGQGIDTWGMTTSDGQTRLSGSALSGWMMTGCLFLWATTIVSAAEVEVASEAVLPADLAVDLPVASEVAVSAAGLPAAVAQ